MKTRFHTMTGGARGLIGRQMEVVALEASRRLLVRLGKTGTQVDSQTAFVDNAGVAGNVYFHNIKPVNESYAKTDHAVAGTFFHLFCEDFSTRKNINGGGITVRQRKNNINLIILDVTVICRRQDSYGVGLESFCQK
jgi:hypothetical protein